MSLITFVTCTLTERPTPPADGGRDILISEINNSIDYIIVHFIINIRGFFFFLTVSGSFGVIYFF